MGCCLYDPEIGIDLVGFAGSTGSWWTGLSMFHTLFIKEHNLICDRLKQIYPDWKDEQLFDKARLINAAFTSQNSYCRVDSRNFA